MKTLMFTVMLAALTAGLATAGGYGNRSCVNNNSKACRDARDAFASHHGGVYPRQYQNHAYNTYNNNHAYWNDRDGDRHHEKHHDRDHDGD